MRIGIDAREIEDGIRTGIGRALQVFINYFEKQRDGNDAKLFSTRRLSRQDSQRVRNVTAPNAMTFYWDQFVLPRLIRSEKIDLFYSPYYKIPFRSSCPCVSTIYDLMYLTYPAYAKQSRLSRFYYKTIGKALINKAKRIITSSKFSCTEIASFYKVDQQKIKVIPLGLPASYKPVRREAVDRLIARLNVHTGYVLYTGNFKPHKNAGTLVKAFSEVHKRFPELFLILAGSHDHHFAPIKQEIKSSEIASLIIAPGIIDEPDLPALYSGARLFVMPSLYEGFGFPPLEAIACGAPVVCSNATSLPEVVGDAAIMVDARDWQELARAMIRVLESPDLAKSLSTKGINQAQKFSGDSYAQAVYEVLKDAGQGQG